jgi:hypothetical protein
VRQLVTMTKLSVEYAELGMMLMVFVCGCGCVCVCGWVGGWVDVCVGVCVIEWVGWVGRCRLCVYVRQVVCANAQGKRKKRRLARYDPPLIHTHDTPSHTHT